MVYTAFPGALEQELRALEQAAAAYVSAVMACRF